MFFKTLDCLPLRLSFAALALSLGLSEYALARETARVLPKGIRRFRVVGVMTGEVKDTFNENGDLQGLSYSLNRSVSLSDMRSSASSEKRAQIDQMVGALNGLQAGLGDQLLSSGGNLFSDITMKQQVYMPAFEYGVSDKLSLGIRIPIVKRSARISFNAAQGDTARRIKEQVGNLNPALSSGLEALAGFNTSFYEDQMFISKGYEAPRDFNKTQLGDLEFGGKLNFHKGEYTHSTVQLGFCAPTGAKANMRNPFDKGNSKETWGMAGQFFQEVNPTKALTLGGAAKLSVFLPDTRERAVPLSANDPLPSLKPEAGQVQQVRRQRGSQIDTEVSADLKLFGDAFEVWGAYQYAQKSADSYSGPGNLHYESLGKNSEWNATTGEAGIGYSTIPAFRKKAFKLPLEVTLLYSKTLTGKNTPLSDYARMDLMVYF